MRRSVTLSAAVALLVAAGCTSAGPRDSTRASSTKLTSGISFKQGSSGELGAPAMSLDLTLSGVQAGDLLVGWFLDDSATGPLAVTDTVNGAWTRAAAQPLSGGAGGDAALYYKANAAAGDITITVSTTSAAYIQATVSEYAGIDPISPLDKVTTGFGSGATGSVGPTDALGAADELVYVATSNGATVSSMTAGPGFALRSSNDATGEEDAIASSTAGQSGSFSFASSTDWNMVVATFRPAGSPSCTPTTCAAAGATCGTVSDGCGGSLACGTCASGQSCTSNTCTAGCAPTTCAAQGKGCGGISDGCGGTLACGTCSAPATCGGGGSANVCGGGTVGGTPHVMIIVMENHGYHDIIGSSSAPYINGLATSFVSATNWVDVSHPSLPNYLALTAGSIFSNPQDCRSAFNTSGGDCTFHSAGPNLADQLTSAGISWKAYIEDLPTVCDTTDAFTGQYDVNHNPFMYYDNVVNSAMECNSDVPYPQLATDLANNTLPSFIWLTPNLIHDMHDGTIADGDNFLKGVIPRIQASSWYAQGGAVIVTWDEGETEEQVALIVVSAKTAGIGAFTGQGNHYGTLRSIEEEYGLPLLNNASDASNGDIRALLP